MTDDKKRVGRPPGSRTVKAGEPMKASRMLDLIDSCYDQATWAAKFKRLSPESQFKYRSQLEPRALEEEGPRTFVLSINYPPTVCPSCGFALRKEKSDG